MKKQMIYFLALVLLIATGCQKELSFEGPNTPAKGTLQDDVTGDCLPKTVNGTYVVGTQLVPATNTIVVQVNVTQTGTFVVTTDTMNGFYFRATGTFTTLGATNVTLRGYGTPFSVGSGVTNFVVSFDTTFCDIQVPITSPGIGSLEGSPNACAPIAVNGGYSPGVALTAANNAVVQVNVTTAGIFNITTDTVAGIWFSFSGSLALSPPPQNVTLVAYGAIPTGTVTGSKTFTVKLGTSICTFVVNVAGPADGTCSGAPNACTPSTVFGTSSVGSAVTAAAGDSVQIQINVTTAGAYNITTNTVTGFSFAGSGIVAVGNNQTITLYGNGGIATTAGPQTFTVTFGTSSCTFVVNVLTNDYFPRTTNSNWSYEWNDDLTDSVLRFVISTPLSAPPNSYSIFMPDEGGGLDSTGPNYSAGYYRKNGGDYFERFNTEDFFGFDPPPLWGEYIMLKDNVTAPSTPWVSPGFAGIFAGFPINISFKYRVLNKDISKTINTSIDPGGKTYQNVIEVEERYEVEITPGVWQDATSLVGYGKSFYARGIGLILFEAYDQTQTLVFWQELRRYEVN